MIVLTVMELIDDTWVLEIHDRVAKTRINIEATDKVSGHAMARAFCVAINENSPDLATRIVAGR